jgi:hypothetical protein
MPRSSRGEEEEKGPALRACVGAGPCPTTACRRPPPASAPPSLRLPAAPEAWRWAPRVRETTPPRPCPRPGDLPPLEGRRVRMGRTTQRGTVLRQRVRAPCGEACVPPRPGQDECGATTRPGRHHRGALPPVPHSRRAVGAPDRCRPAPVEPRVAGAEGTLLSPSGAPQPGSWAWWRARSWGHGVWRARHTGVVGGRHGGAAPTAAAGVGRPRGACGVVHGKPARHLRSCPAVLGTDANRRGLPRAVTVAGGQAWGRWGHQGAGLCQVQCPTRACT